MEFTALQIAEVAGGLVEGDAGVRVCDFAKIEEAGPGHLTFLANPKYEHYLYSTGASAVLVARTFEPTQPVRATLIRVDDPYATLAQLMRYVQQMLKPRRRGIEQPAHIAEGVDVPDDAYVGAFAYIGRGVQLGRGVQIYPYAYVGDGVTVGDDTVLYPGVTVYSGCRIGARCILHAGAVIGADGFGFAPVGEHWEKMPQLGAVALGDDVEIGANTTVDSATMGFTTIGNGVKLDNLVQIAHNVTVGDNTVMASQAGIAGSTHIGRHCIIAGQVGIVGHITVGDNVTVGAQSGISNDVAEGARIMGSPAIDFRRYTRSTAAWKNLGTLVADINALKRKL